MSISSKGMKKIKECEQLEMRPYRDSYGNFVSTTMFCKLKNKRTYLRECKKCEHKSNMSIVECFYPNIENRGNKTALYQLRNLQ